MVIQTLAAIQKNKKRYSEFKKTQHFLNQIIYDRNTLTMVVSKSPVLIRLILFIVTFLFFALPIFGILINIGNGLKLGSLLIMGLFYLVGFYFLRISLWNHFGKEIIQFTNDTIIYIADYGWFKDAKKVLENTDISYSIKPAGFEEENYGVLIISNPKSEIQSVVKMPREKLENLIETLQNGS